MPQLLSHATGFWLLGHEDFLVLNVTFSKSPFNHQQVDNFFHHCANVAWITKGSRGPLPVLPAFYNDIAMGACMTLLFQGEPLLLVKVLLS